MSVTKVTQGEAYSTSQYYDVALLLHISWMSSIMATTSQSMQNDEEAWSHVDFPKPRKEVGEDCKLLQECVGHLLMM